MLDKIGNFVNGIASGVSQQVSDIAAQNPAVEKKKADVRKTMVGELNALKQRVVELEAQNKTIFELIGLLQNDAMQEPEPEQDEDVSA